MSKVLFIAPTSTKLNLSSDLAAVGNGNEFEEVADGLLDRSAVERLLRDSHAEILYFASDGDYGILELNGEKLTESDLVQMMQGMRRLTLVVINACNSVGIASEIHNAYHVPVIAMEAKIGDGAAIQFARTFFTGLRTKQGIEISFKNAKAAVGRLYPNNATTPRLLNGDMASEGRLQDCMKHVQTELTLVNERLNAMGEDMRLIKQEQADERVRWNQMIRMWQIAFIAAILIGVLLIVAQIATPFIDNSLFKLSH